MSRAKLIERTATALRMLADRISNADHDSGIDAGRAVEAIEAAFQQVENHLRYLSALYPEVGTQSALAYCFRTFRKPDLMISSLAKALCSEDYCTKQEVLASFENALLEQKTELDRAIERIIAMQVDSGLEVASIGPVLRAYEVAHPALYTALHTDPRSSRRVTPPQQFNFPF